MKIKGEKMVAKGSARMHVHAEMIGLAHEEYSKWTSLERGK